MLEVKPIEEKSAQEAACLRCGIEYDADLLAYAATVDDELVGVCQFTLTPEGGSLRAMATVTDREQDLAAMFVLGRSTLNFIDLCGIHAATYDGPMMGEQWEVLLRAIGFEQREDGRWFVDLTNFFEHPCEHHATGI